MEDLNKIKRMKRPIDGLTPAPGGNKYLDQGNVDFTREYKVVPLLGNFNADQDDDISLYLDARPNELIRLPPDPIVIKYKVFRAGEQERLNTLDGSELAYIHPFIGGQTFYDKCVAVIDGHFFDPPRTGPLHYYWQNINRTFCTEEYRNEQFDYPKPRPRTGFEHDNNLTATDDKWTLTPARVTDYEDISAASKTATANVVHLGFDCLFPFSSQSSALAALEGKKISNSFFHPGVRIELQLHKRDKWYSLIQKPLLYASDHYDGQHVVVAQRKLPDFSTYVFKIVSVGLRYESWTPTNQAPLNDMKRFGTVFYQDLPTVVTRHITPGIYSMSHTLKLPARTKIVFFSMAPSYCLSHIIGSNKPMSAASVIPATMSVLKFRIDGVVVGPEHGYRYPGRDGYADPGCQNYHQDIVRKGLYDSPIRYMFPMHAGLSLEQTIILDLTTMSTRHAPVMEVEMTFTTATPANWQSVICSVRQVKHTCKHSGNDLWTWTSNQEIN